jgi:hypothetical protein
MWTSGGKLNVEKCYYYAFEPKLNYTTQKIGYKRLYMPEELLLYNHKNGVNQHVTSFPPSTARLTLGVFLSPTGDVRTQMNHTTIKAKEFLGKIKKMHLCLKKPNGLQLIP